MTCDRLAELVEQMLANKKQLRLLEPPIRGDRRENDQKRAQILRRLLGSANEWAGLDLLFQLVGDLPTARRDLRRMWREHAQKIDLGALPDMLQTPRFTLEELALLSPAVTWAFSFSFTLADPYFSNSSQEWGLSSNRLHCEHTWGFPVIESTSWKGALRAALWQQGYAEDHLGVQRLFGSTSGDGGQKGRCTFYASFFTEKGTEVMHPQVGLISFEVVPAGAVSEFSVLYVLPPPYHAETHAQVHEDLALLVEGIEAMLFYYGVGGKTSSGWGKARHIERGSFVARLPTPIQKPFEDFSSLHAIVQHMEGHHE